MQVIERLEGVIKNIDNDKLVLDLSRVKDSQKDRRVRGLVATIRLGKKPELKIGSDVAIYIARYGGYARHRNIQYEVYTQINDDGEQKFVGTVQTDAIQLNIGA
jgi:hypothetical protein